MIDFPVAILINYFKSSFEFNFVPLPLLSKPLCVKLIDVINFNVYAKLFQGFPTSVYDSLVRQPLIKKNTRIVTQLTVLDMNR